MIRDRVAQPSYRKFGLCGGEFYFLQGMPFPNKRLWIGSGFQQRGLTDLLQLPVLFNSTTSPAMSPKTTHTCSLDGFRNRLCSSFYR
jgi:hypothetical protein